MEWVKCEWCKKGLTRSVKDRETIQYHLQFDRIKHVCPECFNVTYDKTDFNFCSLECLQKWLKKASKK